MRFRETLKSGTQLEDTVHGRFVDLAHATSQWRSIAGQEPEVQLASWGDVFREVTATCFRLCPDFAEVSRYSPLTPRMRQRDMGPSWRPLDRLLTRYQPRVMLVLPDFNAMSPWCVCTSSELSRGRWMGRDGAFISCTQHLWLCGADAFFHKVELMLLELQLCGDDVLDSIEESVMPSDTQITDARDQDRLLFDSDDLERSKAYLFAHHTLAIFGKDVLANEKRIRNRLGLTTSDLEQFEVHWMLDELPFRSIEERYLTKSLRVAKRRIEERFEELRQRRERAIQLQGEIQRLFASLYQMTSIRETQKSFQQNENIKLLTIVTIFFLPLSYVTSVYGMNNMPTDGSFAYFAGTTVAVCVPVYIIMAIIFVDAPRKRYGRWLMKHSPFKWLDGGANHEHGERGNEKDRAESESEHAGKNRMTSERKRTFFKEALEKMKQPFDGAAEKFQRRQRYGDAEMAEQTS